MSDLISLRAYAKSRRARGLTGGSLAAVQKAIAAERIRLSNGKIDPQVADIQWERNTDPVGAQRGASGGSLDAGVQTSAPASTAGADSTAASPESGVPPEVREEQRKRLASAARADDMRAELLNYELEQKRGNLVRAEDVKREAFEKARVARDALMAIPDRITPLVAAETDPAKVRAILVSELRKVCAELAAGEASPTRQ